MYKKRRVCAGSSIKRRGEKTSVFLRVVYSHFLPRNRVKHLVTHVHAVRPNTFVYYLVSNTGIIRVFVRLYTSNIA